MAEFIEVARAKRRMCKAHTGECDECKLQGNCSLLNVCAYSDDDVKKLENEVMSWAAEHPEPVYPTWEEWLVANGVMEPDNVRLNGDYRFYYKGKPVYNIPSPKMFMQIPADIAEKLGIEPKEGWR